MPSISTEAKLGFSNPGGINSEHEREWKKENLVKAQGVSVVKTLWVHKAVVTEFNALCIYLQANGARLGENVDDWGFSNRDIRGYPGVKSYHAFGLAIDLDATENPMGVRKSSFARTNRDKKETFRVCELLGLRWGLFYTGRPDAMHFEFIKSKRRARYIRSRLIKSTKRSRTLAKLCDMPVDEFCRRVKLHSNY